MRKRKLLPWVFLTTLLLIVTFLVGISYGRRVADVDLITAYMKKYATPSAMPTPTHSPLQFKELSLAGCNIKFLYPGTIDQVQAGTNAAQLTNNHGEDINVSCARPTSQPTPTPATFTEIAFKGRQIKAISTDQKGYAFSLSGYAASSIQVEISRNLYPLFESSLQRIK